MSLKESKQAHYSNSSLIQTNSIMIEWIMGGIFVHPVSVDILLLESINEILYLPFNNSKNLWNITELLISLRVFATCRCNMTLQQALAVMLIFLQYNGLFFLNQRIICVHLPLSHSLFLTPLLSPILCYRISSQIFVKWVTFIT